MKTIYKRQIKGEKCGKRECLRADRSRVGAKIGRKEQRLRKVRN